MKNKIMYLLMLSVSIASLSAPITTTNAAIKPQERTAYAGIVKTIYDSLNSYHEINLTANKNKTIVTVTKDNSSKILKKHQELLNKREVNEKWYKKYKDFVKKHKKLIPKDQTLYDDFSDKEIEILHRIVEAEVTDAPFDAKVNVANVIINRVMSEEFPDTIEEVVFQKYQFSPTADGRYYSVSPTESTLLAIEYAYMFPDTTYDALFFDATNGNSWASTHKVFIFTDGFHDFYK